MAFLRSASVNSTPWTRLRWSPIVTVISSSDSSWTSKPHFIPNALQVRCFFMVPLLSAVFLRDGLHAAVLPPKALLLVALIFCRGPVAVEVPLGPLDGPNEIGLPHAGGTDAQPPSPFPDLLHVQHDPPPPIRPYASVPSPFAWFQYTPESPGVPTWPHPVHFHAGANLLQVRGSSLRHT